jgi:hypothetical protein
VLEVPRVPVRLIPINQPEIFRRILKYHIPRGEAMMRKDQAALLRTGRPFAALPMFFWTLPRLSAERYEIPPEVDDRRNRRRQCTRGNTYRSSILQPD